MECLYSFELPTTAASSEGGDQVSTSDPKKPEEEARMQLRGVCSHSQWDGRSFEDTKHAILDKKEYPLSETLKRLARLASELKVYRASLPKSGSKGKADPPNIKAR